MPATRATASTSPLVMAPRGDLRRGLGLHVAPGTGRRPGGGSASLAVTSTMRARPSGSRCVNSEAGMGAKSRCAAIRDRSAGRRRRRLSRRSGSSSGRAGRSRPGRCGARPTSCRPRRSIAAASGRRGRSSSRAAAQDGAQVGLVEREQAGAELALGGDRTRSQLLAERLGDAGDHADVADAVAVAEPLGRLDVLAVLRRTGSSGNTASMRSRISCAGTTWSRLHSPVGVEGHELDEAHADALARGRTRRGRRPRRR